MGIGEWGLLSGPTSITTERYTILYLVEYYFRVAPLISVWKEVTRSHDLEFAMDTVKRVRPRFTRLRIVQLTIDTRRKETPVREVLQTYG